MEKKFEEEERLKHIEDEAKRAEEKERIQGQKVRHKEHGKVHHPMTKDQLEEVWENQDHMRAEDWNPKTFFAMHDLNGDNFWDEDEVRVLFRKELDKVLKKIAVHLQLKHYYCDLYCIVHCMHYEYAQFVELFCFLNLFSAICVFQAVDKFFHWKLPLKA